MNYTENLLTDNRTICVLNISCVDVFSAGQSFTRELVELVINNHTVTSLDLRCTDIKPDHLKELCTALSSNISIKSFLISGNHLAKSMDSIAELIKKNSHIQFLDLNRTQIGDAGALKLIRALMYNSSLQSIDLTATLLTDESGVPLAKILENHSSLTSVGLSHNSLTVVSARAVLKAIESNPSLNELFIIDNIKLSDTQKIFNTKIRQNQELFDSLKRLIQCTFFPMELIKFILQYLHEGMIKNFNKFYECFKKEQKDFKKSSKTPPIDHLILHSTLKSPKNVVGNRPSSESQFSLH